MTKYTRFTQYFFHALFRVWNVVVGLIAWLVINAAAIAYFEKISFGDALYFTFVTALTIGYGDISPATLAGRIVAIMTGVVGIIITGLIVAVAVYALKKTMEHSADGH